MNTVIVRKSTVRINLRSLTNKINTVAFHEVIAEQCNLEEAQLESIDFCNYKKLCYIKCKSLDIAEAAIRSCQGKLVYEDGGILQELPVQLETNNTFQAVVFPLPLEVSSDQVVKIFQQFGVVTGVSQLSFSQSHRFKIYNGKRIITFSKLHRKLPLFLNTLGINLQIFLNFHQEICDVCSELCDEKHQCVNAKSNALNRKESPISLSFADFPNLVAPRQTSDLRNAARLPESQLKEATQVVTQTVVDASGKTEDNTNRLSTLPEAFIPQNKEGQTTNSANGVSTEIQESVAAQSSRLPERDSFIDSSSLDSSSETSVSLTHTDGNFSSISAPLTKSAKRKRRKALSRDKKKAPSHLAVWNRKSVLLGPSHCRR